MDATLIAIVIGASVLGGILRTLLGWFQSHDEISPKKIGRSLGIAVILGIIFGATYPEMGAIPALLATFAGVVVAENIGIGIKKSIDGKK